MESLDEQRQRLQRQVQLLEQSLSQSDPQLLSSSSDESDTSEDSDQDQDQDQSGSVSGPGLGAELLEQRELLHRQIQELERTIGPTFSEDQTGEDDDEESSSDESECPVSVEGCLQMNLVYQEVLQETLEQLDALLQHNHRQQQEVLAQMTGSSSDHSRSSRGSSFQNPAAANVYLGRFLKPYFKDRLTGLGPPANPESREKAALMVGSLDEKKLKIRRWEGWQKVLLIHAVSRDRLRKLVQPKLSRLEFLTQKLLSVSDLDRPQISEQIQTLEKDIQALREKKEEELMGDRFEDMDWDRISNIDFEGSRDPGDLLCFWRNFLHPSINKDRWSDDEIRKLKDLSLKNQERDWTRTSQELGTGRTAFMCLQTYQRFVSVSLRKRTWTPEEDAQLRDLVQRMRIGNFIPYTQMCYFMEDRLPGQLIYRWNQVLDPRLKKGQWSAEEDQLLLSAIERHGARHWWKIRYEVPGRTDSACRDRYHDVLKVGVRRGPFEDQEKLMLRRLVQKHGAGRWSRIAAEIPNRTDAQCMRAWNALLRDTRIFTRKATPGQTGKATPGRTGKATPGQTGKATPGRTGKATETTGHSGEDTQPSEKPGGCGAIKMEPLTPKRSERKRRRPARLTSEYVDFSSDEEDEEVLYMDTSDEEEKLQIPQTDWEEPTGAADIRPNPDFTVTPMSLWRTSKPLNKTSFCFRPVALVPSAGASRGKSVRCTLVNNSGNSVVDCPCPKELAWEERHRGNIPMMISLEDLRGLFYQQAGKFTPCRGQKTNTQRHTDLGLTYDLQAALMPWVGNVVIQRSNRLTVAEEIQRHGAKVELSSSSVFMFFLRALQVDAEGCKTVIEERRSQEVIKERRSQERRNQRLEKAKNNKTVAGILVMKQLQNVPPRMTLSTLPTQTPSQLTQTPPRLTLPTQTPPRLTLPTQTPPRLMQTPPRLMQTPPRLTLPMQTPPRMTLPTLPTQTPPRLTLPMQTPPRMTLPTLPTQTPPRLTLPTQTPPRLTLPTQMPPRLTLPTQQTLLLPPQFAISAQTQNVRLLSAVFPNPQNGDSVPLSLPSSPRNQNLRTIPQNAQMFTVVAPGWAQHGRHTPLYFPALQSGRTKSQNVRPPSLQNQDVSSPTPSQEQHGRLLSPSTQKQNVRLFQDSSETQKVHVVTVYSPSSFQKQDVRSSLPSSRAARLNLNGSGDSKVLSLSDSEHFDVLSDHDYAYSPRTSANKSQTTSTNGSTRENCSKTEQDGCKTAEDGGKTVEDSNKTKQDGGKMAADGGKTSAGGGKTVEDGGKTAEEGGKTAEDGSKTAEDGDKTTEDDGKTTEDGGKTTEDGGKTTEDGGKTEQDGGKTEQDGGKMAADGGKMEQDGGKTATDGGKMEQDGGKTAEDCDEDADSTLDRKRKRKPTAKAQALQQEQAKKQSRCRTSGDKCGTKSQKTQPTSLPPQPTPPQLLSLPLFLVSLTGSNPPLPLSSLQSHPSLCPSPYLTPPNPSLAPSDPSSLPNLTSLPPNLAFLPSPSTNPSSPNVKSSPLTCTPLPPSLTLLPTSNPSLPPFPPSSNASLPPPLAPLSVLAQTPPVPNCPIGSLTELSDWLGVGREQQKEVSHWLSGEGGVVMEGGGNNCKSLPYLPPFAASLSALSSLLRQREELTQNAVKILQRKNCNGQTTNVKMVKTEKIKWQREQNTPRAETEMTQTGQNQNTENGDEETRLVGCVSAPNQRPEQSATTPTNQTTPGTTEPANETPRFTSVSNQEPAEVGEAELIEAVRRMVRQCYGSNPAHQLLRARLLSVFTLPALLASLQPITAQKDEEEPITEPITEQQKEVEPIAEQQDEEEPSTVN